MTNNEALTALLRDGAQLEDVCHYLAPSALLAAALLDANVPFALTALAELGKLGLLTSSSRPVDLANPLWTPFFIVCASKAAIDDRRCIEELARRLADPADVPHSWKLVDMLRELPGSLGLLVHRFHRSVQTSSVHVPAVRVFDDLTFALFSAYIRPDVSPIRLVPANIWDMWAPPVFSHPAIVEHELGEAEPFPLACRDCGANPALDGHVTLHRINPTGVPGIWLCDVCRGPSSAQPVAQVTIVKTSTVTVVTPSKKRAKRIARAPKQA